MNLTDRCHSQGGIYYLTVLEHLNDMQISKKLTLFMFMSVFLLNSSLYAQIVTDSTLGGLEKELQGPDFKITHDLGQLQGNNLFHSFKDFNIHVNEAATFSGPANVSNILARVTGNQRSIIDGTLRSEIDNANLYLLNPNGILFGQNAHLDVSGSFHASTADGIKLGDDGKFLARSPTDSKLTMSEPSAFGFLDSQPASIEIRGDTLAIKNQTYYAPNGQINVTATDIRLEDSTWYAPNGKINITAKHDLQISQSSLDTLYQIEDMNGDGETETVGTVDVSGRHGDGRIFIRAGQFALDKSLIFADNYGDGQGFNIDIGIDGEMYLKNGARITTDKYASGPGGNLTIAARLLQFSGHNDELKDPTIPCNECSTIAANNSNGSTGAGGNIRINTSTLEITHGLIQSATQTDGAAGNIKIEANNVSLKEQGYIAANTRGQGQGGTINITAKDMISLDDSNITAQTDGIGKAGDISIKTEKLNLANKGIISSLSNLDGSNAGSAGSIDIEAGTINISTDRNVPISKDTWNDVSGIAVIAKKARGGNIDMEVRDSLSLVHSKITARSTGQNSSDNGGNIWIKGLLFSKLRELKLVDKGYILASADAGNGGDIEIWAENAFLSDNSSISATAIQASGGNINLNMRDWLVLFNSEITTASQGNKPGDDGGNLNISNFKVLALDKSQLIASANGGYGGKITAKAGWILGKVKPIERKLFAQIDRKALEEERNKVIQDWVENKGYSVMDATSSIEGQDGILETSPLRWEFPNLKPLDRSFWRDNLSLDRCAYPDRSGKRSYFIINARDILPRSPEDLR